MSIGIFSESPNISDLESEEILRFRSILSNLFHKDPLASCVPDQPLPFLVIMDILLYKTCELKSISMTFLVNRFEI